MMPHAVEILLVEDDPQDVELTLHALTRENLCNRIEVARDGEEALDFVFCRGAHQGRDPASLPKLVLLDLKLPKVDGLEVLRRIKQDPRARMIPVVLLTSSREEKDRLCGYQSGANSYVCKPVDYEKFRQALKQLGLYWLSLNQPPPPAG